MFYTEGTFPVTPTHKEWDMVHSALAAVLPETDGHIVPEVQLKTVPDLANYLQRRQQDLRIFADSYGVDSWASPAYAAPEDLDRGIFAATVLSRWSRLTQLLHDPDGHIPDIVEFVVEDILFSWWRVVQDIPDSFTAIHSGLVADHMLPTEVLSCGDLPAICFIEGAQMALRYVFSDADQWRYFCWQMPLALEKQI